MFFAFFASFFKWPTSQFRFWSKQEAKQISNTEKVIDAVTRSVQCTVSSIVLLLTLIGHCCYPSTGPRNSWKEIKVNHSYFFCTVHKIKNGEKTGEFIRNFVIRINSSEITYKTVSDDSLAIFWVRGFRRLYKLLPGLL